MASDNDFRALIRVEIDPSSLQSVDKQIKSIIGDIEKKNHQIHIDFDRESIANVRKTLDELEAQLERMSEMRIELGGSGRRVAGGGQDAITRTYNELLLLQERIKGTQQLLNNTRPNTDRYQSLSRALHDLQQDYTVLRRVANSFFSDEQRGNLDANLQNAVQNATVLQETFNETNREFEKLTNLSSKLASLRTSVAKLDPNSEEYAVLSRELKNVNDQYNRLRQMAGQDLTSGQIEQLNNDLRETDLAIERINARLQDQQNKADIAKSFGNLKGLASDIASLQVAMEKLNPKSEEYAVLKEQLDAVTKEYKELLEATKQDLSDEQIKQLAQRLDEASKKVEQLKARMADQREIKEYNANWKDLVATLNRMKAVNNKRAGLDTRTDKKQLQELNEEYERLGKHAKEIYDLIKGSMPVEHQQQFNRLIQEEADSFALLQAKLKDTGGLFKGFINGFKESASNAVAYMFSGYRILTAITQAIKDAYNNVVEIDSAMTELKKVTDETDSAYSQFLSGAGARATEIGTTVSDYINSTADFARLGYDFVDSQELARVASIYAVVGDEIEGIDQASQSVISTMAAFNIEAGDAMSIIDKFNEVGNNFAISSGGIGEALTRSASALYAAGNTLDESIAMITAANRVVQDPQQIGTAFKTLTMRIRGAKTEMEEAGLDTEGMATSVSKLRDQIIALSGVDIMIDDDTFKSTYQILKELSEVWGELTDVSRANITELIAGKRQGNIISALMNDYGEAERVLKVSIDSANSASIEHEKWLNSIEAKTNQLKAAWQSLSKDFISSDFVKSGISILTKFASGIDKIVNSIGGFGTIGIGMGLFSIFKNFGRIKEFISVVSSGGVKLKEWGSYASAAFDGASKLSLGIGAVGLAISAVSLIIGQHNKKMEEMRRKWQENISQGKEAAENIGGIESALESYDDIQDKYISGTATKEELDEATQNLVSTLGIEEDQLRRLIAEYGDLDTAIRQVTADKIQEATDKIANGYSSAKKALEDFNREKFFGGQWSELDWLEDTAEAGKNLGKALEEAGLIGSGNYNKGGAIMLGDDAVKAYQTMIDMQETLTKAAKDGTLGMSLDELYQTDLWGKLSNKISEASDSVENYLYFVDELNNKNISGFVSDFGKVDNVEQFNELYKRLTDNVGESSGIFVGSIDDQTEAIERFMLESKEFSEFYKQSPEYVEKATKSYRESFRRNMSGDSTYMSQQIMHWFDDLQFEDKELAVNIGINNDSSLYWNLDQWKNALSEVKEQADESTVSIEYFYDILKDSSEGSLTETINKSQEYVASIEEIQDKLSGGLTRQDQVGIVAKFPELEPYINDTEKLDLAIDKLIDDSYQTVDDAFRQAIESTGDASSEAALALQRYWDMIKEVREVSSADYPNIIEERQRYSDIGSGYESGQKAGGMNSEEIAKIENAFKELKSYDPSVLFERTTHGVQLNTIALRTLNKEYEIATKSSYREHLNKLVQSYNSLARQLMETTDAQERDNISARMKAIQEEANSVADEAAQYDGLTAAYKRWQEASSITDSRAEWENMGKGLENVKELVSAGWVNDNEVISFMNMFLEDGEKITSWAEAQEGTWSAVQTTIGRYFDGTTGSLQQFLTDASSVEGELFSIQQMADGSWDFDFEFGGEAELATVLSDMYGVQLSAESVQYILEALSDSNFEVHIESDVDQPTQAIADVEQQIQNLQALTERDWKGKKQDAILGIDTEGAISELETAIADATTTTEESDIELPVVVDDEDLQDFLNGRYNDFKATVEDPMYLNLEDTEAQSSLDQFKIVWDSLHDKTVHLSVARNEISAESYASGTAFAQGNWGTKKSGVALVGELGTELLVRDGKYYTIGDNGAEFIKYKRGDVIFNAVQTAELFKYGGTRGRGIAFASGTAFDGGSEGRGDLGPGSPTNPTTPSNPVDPGDLDEITESAEEATEAVEELKEVFDWIQVKIERIEREITNLGRTAESVFKSWSTRNNALSEELEKVTEEIEIQQQGVERYRQEAENVGLDEEWAQKVRDGLIDIERLQSEATEESKEETQALIDKIQEYQKWYELMLDCEDAVEELKEQQAELIKQRFDNVTNMYDQYFSTMDTGKALIENGMKRTEAMGYTLSPEYYKALIRNEKSNMKLLKKERKKLVKELDEAMQSGEIEEGSEAWFEMAQKIDQCTLAIEEADTAIVEYRAQIQQLKWDAFDEALKRIQEINTESSFMIDLMSKYNQYTESGQLSKQGMATMALHAVEHNVYMKQSAALAAEIKKLNKEIADDPANQKLIDRRSELLKLQQDAILGAESEKKAIKDMVADGIQIELDNLQKLIDNYTTLLDKQKDQFEYSKKVAKQTKQIADIQKQLAAYEGDDSEENRARVQQLRVSLEEAQESLQDTQYDKYVSDTKTILSDLYTQYEKMLNSRLDNVDQIAYEMMETINENPAKIAKTVAEETKNVGYAMSDAMSTIFDKQALKNQPLIDNILKDSKNVDIQKAIENLSNDDGLGGKLNDVKGAVDGVKGALTGEGGVKGSVDGVKGAVGGLGTSLAAGSGSSTLGEAIGAQIASIGGVAGTLINHPISDGKTFGTALGDIDAALPALDYLSKLFDLDTGVESFKSGFSSLIDDKSFRTGYDDTSKEYLKDIRDDIEEKLREQEVISPEEEEGGGEGKKKKKKKKKKNAPTPETPTNPPEPETPTDHTKKEYYGVALAIMNNAEKSGWDNAPSRYENLTAKGFDADRVQRIINKYFYTDEIQDGTWEGSSKWYGLKLSDLKNYYMNKFATGVKNVARDQMAWTQEGGAEYIMRKSDGALLTPLTSGDGVLNARASENLWQMANTPEDFIKKNLGIGATALPSNASIGNSYSQNFDNITFLFPNVKNYDEMLRQMQRDKNFERLIENMVFDPLNGKSSYSKLKAVR